MAPCSNTYSSGQHAMATKKNNNRLRKPAVEKRRRDRINSCIEQLRVILETDVHRQNFNSKLEKADILEMTVSLLRQQQQDNTHSWRESALFLSTPSSSEPSLTPPPTLQHQDQKLQQAQGGSSSTLRVWRPW